MKFFIFFLCPFAFHSKNKNKRQQNRGIHYALCCYIIASMYTSFCLWLLIWVYLSVHFLRFRVFVFVPNSKNKIKILMTETGWRSHERCAARGAQLMRFFELWWLFSEYLHSPCRASESKIAKDIAADYNHNTWHHSFQMRRTNDCYTKYAAVALEMSVNNKWFSQRFFVYVLGNAWQFVHHP